jgi:NodT family efflux transporter outer membrane factor (OMF) lipoprotein
MSRMLRPALLASACAILLAGCVLGPDFERPTNAVAVASFARETPAGGSIHATEALPPARWWAIFDDPELDALEARVIAANLDIRAATARVRQSRARMGIAQASGLPTVNGATSYQRQRSNPAGLSGVPSAATSPSFDAFQFGVDAAWELDLWGQARRTVEVAHALDTAAHEDRRFAVLAVQAEVARDYIALRGNQALLAILGDTLKTARDSAKLAHSRFDNGVTTRLDVANAEAEVATIEAKIPSIEAARDEQINALGLLLAMGPHALEEELTAFQAQPLPARDVPVGLPSNLLRRRPDVRRAEAALHAATARIGIAKADFYPRISLTGSFGSEALQLSDFGNWSSRQLSVGPTITLPLFQGGRLRGTLELRTAEQQEAAIEYHRTVLNAWREVDDALTTYAAETRRRSSLDRAVEQNTQALAIAQRRYQEGAIDFLNVLSVQKALLESRGDLVLSSVADSQEIVTLYKALGGEWELDFPEDEGHQFSAIPPQAAHP